MNFRKYLSPLQEITNRKGRQFIQGIYFSGFFQGSMYSGSFEGIYRTYDPVTSLFVSTPYQYSVKAQNMAFGLAIGIQQIFWKVLSFDVFVGAGYQVSDKKIKGDASDWYSDYYDFTDPGYYGILPKIGLHLGLTL